MCINPVKCALAISSGNSLTSVYSPEIASPNLLCIASGFLGLIVGSFIILWTSYIGRPILVYSSLAFVYFLSKSFEFTMSLINGADTYLSSNLLMSDSTSLAMSSHTFFARVVSFMRLSTILVLSNGSSSPLLVLTYTL